MDIGEKIEKKSGGSLAAWIFVFIAVCGYVYQLGVTSSSINENTRRIQGLEQRSDSFMSKQDAADIKQRLEKIDEKVDRISQRQAHGN